MATSKQQRILSLSAVAVGATVLGIVIAGGLGVTPRGDAARNAAASPAPVAAGVIPSAPAAPVNASAGFPDFATLAEKVVPSVIAVTTAEEIKPADVRRFHRNMDPFEFFFGNPTPDGRPQTRRGAGSGFFISPDGLALTNNHVVEGAEKITVRLSDDATDFQAKVVGRDPFTDVALIKVEGKGPFPYLQLGDSEALRVGEWVMAVGNPLRMAHTVTVGVVSAKGRALGLSADTQSFENFIQTDAAINLGNSGGPLVNTRGEVVGINTAINAAGQNLGFAVPSNTAKGVLPQLKDKGKVTRGYMGVNIRNIDKDTQDAFNLSSKDGAFVASVEKGTPAFKAGLRKGDTIVALNGTPVKTTRELIDKVSLTPPGHKVDLTVVRDGKRENLGVVLGERPGSSVAGDDKDSGEELATNKLGLGLDDLTARTRRQFNVPKDVDGIVITNVKELSPAEEKGLQVGDVITEVNGRAVTSVDDFTSVIKKVPVGAAVRLYVYRPEADRSDYFILRVP